MFQVAQIQTSLLVTTAPDQMLIAVLPCNVADYCSLVTPHCSHTMNHTGGYRSVVSTKKNKMLMLNRFPMKNTANVAAEIKGPVNTYHFPKVLTN